MSSAIRRFANAGRAPLLLLCLLLGLSVALQACNRGSSDNDRYIEGTVEDLYNRGTDLMLAGDFKEAARFFNEVDRQHPYSTWATRAQLMAAYCNYRAREYALAEAGLNRFIRLNPGHRDIAYAFYLRALVAFDQVKDVKRDQTETRKALAGFEEVVKRFPDSKYARDSRRNAALLRDQLAAHELEVGRYYQRRRQHLAAINRFKVVITQYQTTTQVPEALHRLSESYTALGVTEEARRVAAVLGYNYPASEWYVDSYALVENRRPAGLRRPVRSTRNFFRRAWDWLF